MLKNYFKVAFRTLRRQPVSTLINMVGLGMSMAVCLLVLLLIQNQRSYDRFHEKSDRIVRILSDWFRQGEKSELAASPAYLGPALKADVPEVEQTLRIGQIRADAEANAKALYVTGLHVEPSFFELFDFHLLAGDPTTAMLGPHRIILTDKTARKFFGEEDPLGRPFTLEGFGEYTVTGVIQTEGVKSHLRFDVLASFETLEALEQESLADEENFWQFATYVLLRPGASADVLTPHLARYASRYTDPEILLKTQALTAITLGPVLSNEIAAYNLPGFVVWALLGLGMLVMVTAAFNYVGLAVARAVQRAREVGVRKAVGANLTQLRLQFLMESVLTALGGLLVGLLLLSLLVPVVNGLSFLSSLGIRFEQEALLNPGLLGLFLAFTVGVGLLAGLYPAFRLARFSPVLVLRGAVDKQGGSAPRLRRSLAFIQLTFSFFFVITTLLLFRQFSHMLAQHYGFSVADQITVALQGNDPSIFRQELLRNPAVIDVGATSRLPAADGGTSSRLVYDGDTLRTDYFSASAGFVRNLDLAFVAGRNFEEVDGAQPGLLLNETAVRQMGFASPAAALGAAVGFASQEPAPVRGVVRDFQVDAMPTAPIPLVIINDPSYFRTLTVRFHPEGRAAAVAALEELWSRVDDRHVLEHGLYDARARDNVFMQTFRDLLRIIGAVAAIALMVACLGLLSMVAFAAARRTKEIGIRKVMGASVKDVVWLLSREFLLLTVLAAGVGLPLAYFTNLIWLDTFYNRVPFGTGILLTGALLVVMLVLVAVGSQAVRAALADPVQSLRYE